MISTDQRTSNISIIVPTLNEEKNLAALYANIGGLGHELILVDGGSRDATVSQAAALGFTSLQTTGGRGAQLNCGARHASGELLIFLHADTLLPPDFADHIRKILADPAVCCGGFFLDIAEATASMRFVCYWANRRAHRLGLVYGDQAIFIRKQTFVALGMFPETPIMEDFIFIRKAGKTGKIALAEAKVITSGRRWRQQGVVKTTLINQMVVLGYILGVPLKRLALLYRR